MGKTSAARQADPARKRKARPDGGRRAAAPIDFGPLEGWIGFHLRMAQIASFQSFARHARDVDLSPGRFAALMVIGRNPGISQTALSRCIGSDKSTLTPAVGSLVRRGLVRRARAPSDRRVWRLSLTAAGEKMLRELTECARRHDAHLDRIVGAPDRARFLSILRRIATALG